VANDAVTVAYVHPNEITYSWHESLLNLVSHDLGHEARVARGGWLAIRCYGADGIAGARNKAVEQFLAEKDADWLFWIDTDMGFAPETVDRLLEVADPVERPIVGALAFAQKQNAPDGMGGWETSLVPTVYDWVNLGEESGFLSRSTYPVNKVVRCAGTGSACVLIHRSALEKIGAKFGSWYERVPNPTAGGRLMGEDLSFCMRAGAVGLPVFVHTGVRTTHFKPSWLSEQDFWRQVVAEPAIEECAVIVPVMKRPQNAEPFMRSLKASTGMAKVYAVVDADDAETETAWRDAGAETLPSGKSAGTFSEKVNVGYEATEEPWLFLVGDDVRFHAGWLDHAQAVAEDRYHVIGTNDLGPRVLHGQDSPHMLIRRSYVDEVGASWDGPKVVCHEGYRHGFVDLEIALAAKQREVWAMAPGSVVEHLHPAWGKGETDPIYELGLSHADADKSLHYERLSVHAPEVTGASRSV
jgi:glycosyltransferase involved in cell wall biosynthesis